ncbi:MAG: aryl-sulfate sulfotransferase [Spirochaetota bacterium]
MRIAPRIILMVALGATAATVALIATNPLRVGFSEPGANPLGRRASIRSRQPTLVTVTVEAIEGPDVVVSSDGYARDHTVDVLGLYPDRRNRVVIRATDQQGNVTERSRTIRTERLPSAYPRVAVARHLPELIAEGVTFMILGHYEDDGDYVAMPSAIDRYGRVRWFYDGDLGHVLRRTTDGTFIVSNDEELFEITMLGEETGIRWPIPEGFHHDATVLPNGDLLALTTAPGSFEDGLVEVDRESGEIIRAWDYREILDPDRPRQPVNLADEDWLHLNAVEYDLWRDEIIVSGRDQSAVVSIDRSTGELRWILGAHEHWAERFRGALLAPVGERFEWQWGQHAPMVHPDDPDRLLVYDNGNKRSYQAPLAPQDNYSRAVEYELDREEMTVRQVWQYGTRYGSQLYTPFIGDADYLENGNRLVTFGGITRTLDGEPSELFDYEEGAVNRMKISARVVEVTSDTPAVEVATFTFADPDPASYRGYRVYRSMRMPLVP